MARPHLPRPSLYAHALAVAALAVLLGQDVAAAQAAPSAMRINAEPTYVSVVVHGSLERSLQRAEPRYGRTLAAEVARLLRWRGDLQRNVRPGDTLALLFAMGPPRPGQPPAPEVVAFTYRGERLSLEAYRFVDLDGVARYFDARGERIDPVMLHAPVPHYAQITEVVQRGRGKRRHRGDDLMAAEGSAVVLPFSGTITRLNWHRRKNGRCIEVRLDAGYTAHFLHLSKTLPGLMVGQRLAAGTPLGEVGNTGHSSGPHLHYELLRGREPIEPLRVHGRTRQSIMPSQQDAFVRAKMALIERLKAAGRHTATSAAQMSAD